MKQRNKRCGLIVAALAGAACEDEATSSPDRWQPLAADASYAGHTLSEWAAQWGRWSYAQTSCMAPDLDPDGSYCDLYQNEAAPAFFFAGGPPGTERTLCRVPEGKAIVVPLAAFLLDNAGVEESERLTEAELQEQTARMLGRMTDLQLTVDGVEVNDLDSYAVEPTRFSYDLPPAPNWYSCYQNTDLTGTVDPAYLTGYFVVLPPPPPGEHQLEYGGVVFYEDPSASHVRTTFTVE